MSDPKHTSEAIQNYLDHYEYHLNVALQNVQHMMQAVLASEGDSDVHRKLQMYTVPNLTHWISGAQAGNVKDLKETFARRKVDKEKVMTEQSYRGDGHDVLTKPSV